MTIAIFTGPTLPPDAASQVLPGTYLPPASHGDILRLMQRHPRPTVIGIIDGYFQSMAGVRHKEILWAMSEGVHVFGAASMGALRAAELGDFGMIGVGAVFEALHSGELEDDDEVAVEHGPAELGYPRLSEAMVDIRATLARAAERGIIGPDVKDKLIALAKAQFFRSRSYELVLDQASEVGIGKGSIEALRTWLPTGQYSQKRADAVEMLQTIATFMSSSPTRKIVTYRFERPDTWEHDLASAALSQADGEEVHTEEVLDELRLVPDAYSAVHRRAFARALALREAAQQSVRAEKALANAASELAPDRLTEPDRWRRWAKANDLTDEAFDRLIADQAREKLIESMVEPLLKRQLVDSLRIAGLYPEMAQRAARKRLLLRTRDRAHPTLEEIGMSAPALVAWHCQRIDEDIPQDLDEHAKRLGFADAGALLRALAHEYLFVSSAVAERPNL